MIIHNKSVFHWAYNVKSSTQYMYDFQINAKLMILF